LIFSTNINTNFDFSRSMNKKRLVIALIVSGLFGLFCAYGTSTVEIEGFEITLAYLLTIFYARLLIGFFVGIGEHIQLLKNTYQNAALRGALFGLIASIVIAFYGGGVILVSAGIVYGILTDLIATRFS
jgi:hypothetical protein